MTKTSAINVKHAAERLDCSQKHIRELCYTGKLAYFQDGPGSAIRISERSLENYITTCKTTPKIQRVEARGTRGKATMPKRSRGIRKRGTGWEYRIFVNGKEVCKAGFKNYKEALDAKNKAMDKARLHAAGLEPVEDVLFKNYIETYLENADKEDTTLDVERYHLDVLSRHFGDMLLGQITSLHIRQFVKSRDGANKTINNYLNTLSRFLHAAKKDGYLLEVPEIERLRKEPAKSYRPASRDEMVKLLGSKPALKQNFRLFLLMVATTGARPGKEVRGIRWEDVDFEQGTVTIRNEVAKFRRGRTLDLHPQLRLALEQIPENERQGSIVKQRDFRTAWARACVKAEIKGLTPYGLRKLFATECIYSGVQLQDLQYMMGHSDPKITMGIYVEVKRFEGRSVAGLIPSFEAGKVVEGNFNRAETGQDG